MLSCISTRLGGGLLLLSLCALTLGCNSRPERASVKGKVSIGGKNLTAGNVMFFGDDNATASATIDKDGNYMINDAPVGEVKIMVSVPKAPPGGMKMMQRMKNSPAMKDVKSVDPDDPSKRIAIMGDIPANIVPIPDKYSNPETSGLTYTVQRGEQVHDLPLTP